MKIVIVDDDPIARAVLEAELRALGHEPLAAGGADEAWSILASGSARVVVSDWMMPGADGLELCRRVRAAGGDYVYFILLTQQAGSPENEQLASEAEVDDFLLKPVNHHELRLRLRAAERVLGFTRKVRELSSIVPICGYCKKIRDDRNYWQQIEKYLSEHTGAELSHSICPECMKNIVQPQLDRLGIPRPGQRDQPRA
ncbi:MAG: response regulator [Opitutus sp.]|nr:response regulator [Opitutus sp.]